MARRICGETYRDEGDVRWSERPCRRCIRGAEYIGGEPDWCSVCGGSAVLAVSILPVGASTRIGRALLELVTQQPPRARLVGEEWR